MSMLTPPGMGGKYKVTGNAYPRMSRPRRRRLIVAAVAAVVAVGALGWGTLQLIGVFTGQRESRAEGKAACGNPPKAQPAGQADQASPSALPKPGSIAVNVYNATPRTGLAKKVAGELKKRGFKIGKVDNAPAAYDKKIKETALLLGGPDAKPSLTVLATQLSGTRSKTDARKDASVDLLIGNAYKKLADATTAQKTLTALAKPSSKPKPTGC